MIRVIAMIMIFVTMLSTSGCGIVALGRLIEKNETISKDPTSQPIAGDADPRLTIIEAYNRLCEVKSFRAKIVQTGPTRASIITKMEFAAPDRVRSIHYVGTEIETELIAIGSRRFERSKGRWSEAPDRFGSEDFATKCSLENARPGVPGYLETELKLIGPEIINGIKVLTYRSRTDFRSNDGPDSFVVTTSVGVNDGRLYKVEVQTTTDPSLRLDTVTEYSDYDANISIEAPI